MEAKMIVVTGSVVAKAEGFEEARRLSLEHVHRSRTETGCLSHAVHVDCENPLRLVFVEQWESASRDFARNLRPLAAKVTLEVYEANPLKMT
jgi:quinol monooxygenase YgiN